MTGPITQNPNIVHIDERRRTADLTVQWRPELNSQTHPVSANNAVDVFICGQKAFAEIAKDIEAAEDSIDLVCWGFDPGMELVRETNDKVKKDEQGWPRGQHFGSLLDAAAGRGVAVRLLIWYDRLGSAKQNNMPGYTGDQRTGYWIDKTTTRREDMAALGLNSPPPVLGRQDMRSCEQQRHDYCVEWWRRVMAPAEKGDIRTRIEVRLRGGSSSDEVRESLGCKGNEEDLPSSAAGSAGGLATEKMLLERFPTHHQKTILIDYAWKEGAKAVGYVMGLNSVTDYWDSEDHEFDTPLREVDWARKTATAAALPKSRDVSRDPLQDYASRIQGPALQGVQRNFVKAWVRAGGSVGSRDQDALPPKLKAFASPGSIIQIVRTQPQEGSDKSIKNAYWQAASFARQYIYIENQYFYYESWVRHLKETRARFMKGLQKASRPPQMLHLIAVIPSPEDDGMIPRTYDMVKSLGEADSMPNQDKGMKAIGRKWERWSQLPEDKRLDPDNAPVWNAVYATARQVAAPVKNHMTGELEGLGLKVLIARLVTQNKGKPMPRPEQDFRQIYIHSKLMLIDDACFTLGSANMNVRSMAVDSELNMITDDHLKAKDLRKRVWGMHAGGYNKSAGGEGGPVAIKSAFADWQKVMELNKKIVDQGRSESMTGFVIPFEDEREIYFRHG
ncbi:phospholipase D-like domain-containing protein [Variovorax sp. J22P168]|uniref:phospholipase D-like domain-containing protein n=1 Tax=Variovorax jilinensis TaxID=3053513 RepID=UPI0025761F3B|nr:phospholipase D-like domain-containing protein [Variovorax sp. J22P168]MDM0011039.1 phospholipase D-like domain-containing protein [Variovorax sp. J22P168]